MNQIKVWRGTVLVWSIFAVSAVLLGFVYYEGLLHMVTTWEKKEEYGYGYLIPLISMFFVWQKKDDLERMPFDGSWAGVFVLLLGIGLFFLGELSTLFIIIQYAFLVALFGLLLAWLGWRGVAYIWAGLLLLVFMIPLPSFLYNGLSAQMQLISSEIGVWFIRLFGISVYLEGNVIDLGGFKLQVVEACSGLRYLFPLMTLGFIMSYIYKGALWKKIVIFLSAIPITVLMNSFRIGVIGILVEYWGASMAEGFLHDFEGWVVFMACLGILLVLMLILSKIGHNKKSLQDVFAIEYPEPTPNNASISNRKPPATLLASLAVLTVAAASAASIEQRTEIIPERKAFSGFPIKIGDWTGRPGRLERIYLDALKLDDYLLAPYVTTDGDAINLYIAYYASQSKGESAHSPRSCLPGGGWHIQSLTTETLKPDPIAGLPPEVNRVVIQKGDYKQLVYYWFQGRGRVLTNEYMVKWFLFWDALKSNRTDGALIRLTTMIKPGEDAAAADERLTSFLKQMSGYLSSYIPE